MLELTVVNFAWLGFFGLSLLFYALRVPLGTDRVNDSREIGHRAGARESAVTNPE